MERNEEIQQYLELSGKYLQTATVAFEKGLYEPALANTIHALELVAKAALFAVAEESLKTHNVGGLFAQYYRIKIGKDTCKQLNIILNKYNIPRYPGESVITELGVSSILNFAMHFSESVHALLKCAEEKA